MKRLIFAIFCIFFVMSNVTAQARLGDFTMRGAASQVMSAEGLVGAHPSLPFNSVVRITNPRNGREIEVTIIDRMNPSIHWIIDLSAAAMQALGMRSGEQIILAVPAPALQRRQPEPVVNLNEPVLTAQRVQVQDIGIETINNQMPVIEQPPAVQTPAAQAPVVTQDARVPNVARAPETARTPDVTSEQIQNNDSRNLFFTGLEHRLLKPISSSITTMKWIFFLNLQDQVNQQNFLHG
jgi:rare lipoprotein A (peptidoglycan hydrolase)